MDYKSHVGPADKYDMIGAQQFVIMYELGLRDTHKLLDVGCGSLRAGRLFIPYLQSDNYYGIEPARDVLFSGMASELGTDIVEAKRPNFDHNSNFNLSVFQKTFDYILAQSIITHTTIEQTRKIFSEVRKVLKDGGLFVFSYLPGDQDNQKKEWTNSGITYRLQTIKRICINNDLDDPKEMKEKKHPNGLTWCFTGKTNKKKGK